MAGATDRGWIKDDDPRYDDGWTVICGGPWNKLLKDNPALAEKVRKQSDEYWARLEAKSAQQPEAQAAPQAENPPPQSDK
jgi:hypothetical protein